MADSFRPPRGYFANMARNAGRNISHSATVTRIFARLFDLLDQDGACFASGAFVFRDTVDQRLYKLLSRARYNHRMFEGKTHNVFQRASSFNSMRAAPERHKVALRSASNAAGPSRNQYEFILKPTLTGLCAHTCPDCPARDPKRSKRALTFYGFRVKRSQEADEEDEYEQDIDDLDFLVDGRYVYVKLEGHPTYAPSHIKEAVDRYGLGIKGVSESMLSTRREDDFKNKHVSVHYPETATWERLLEDYYREDADQPVSAMEAESNSYDRYLRSTHEMYVPSEITEILVGWADAAARGDLEDDEYIGESVELDSGTWNKSDSSYSLRDFGTREISAPLSDADTYDSYALSQTSAEASGGQSKSAKLVKPELAHAPVMLVALAMVVAAYASFAV